MDLRRGRRRICGEPESHLYALPRGTAEDGSAEGCLVAATGTQPHISSGRFLARCYRGVAARDRRYGQRCERVADVLGGESAKPRHQGAALSPAWRRCEVGELRRGGGW